MLPDWLEKEIESALSGLGGRELRKAYELLAQQYKQGGKAQGGSLFWPTYLEGVFRLLLRRRRPC